MDNDGVHVDVIFTGLYKTFSEYVAGLEFHVSLDTFTFIMCHLARRKLNNKCTTWHDGKVMILAR